MTGEANRLREARKAAGYATAQDAADRFGWNYPTYAGHENGHRGMRPDAMRIYARAYKVDLAWLMDGTGQGPLPAAAEFLAPPPPGFAEPEVQPYIATRPGQDRVMTALAAELTPGLRHREFYMANVAYPAFAILRGDILVIGTPARPTPGEIVVATLALPGPADGRTLLRQRYGDTLVPPLGSALPDEAQRSVGILGTVAAVIRPPAA